MAEDDHIPKPIVIDLLEQEFKRYIEIATVIMNDIKRPQDKQIYEKYLQKCLALNKGSISVKINRNKFFRHFLRVLQMAARNQPMNAKHKMVSIFYKFALI